MKNSTIKIISVLIVLSVITGLCSCSFKKEGTPGIGTTNRSVTVSTEKKKEVEPTDRTVTAVAPQGNEEIIKYFNKALSKFRNNDYEFVKSKNTVLRSYSAGSLTSVSGSTESYITMLKSAVGDMMGVGSLDTSYFLGDDMVAAFPISSISQDKIDSCEATAEGSNVILTFKMKQLSDDGATTVSSLTKDYITPDAFSNRIKGYSATAQSPSVSYSNVTLTAVIDYSTTGFVSVDIGFVSSFSMHELSLAYVKGGPVKGSTDTTVTYKSFAEK